MTTHNLTSTTHGSGAQLLTREKQNANNNDEKAYKTLKWLVTDG